MFSTKFKTVKLKSGSFLFFLNRNSAPESGTINILSHGSPASLFTITPEKLATKWKVSAIATVTSFSTTSSNSCKILRSTQLFNIKKNSLPHPTHLLSFVFSFVFSLLKSRKRFNTNESAWWAASTTRTDSVIYRRVRYDETHQQKAVCL